VIWSIDNSVQLKYMQSQRVAPYICNFSLTSRAAHCTTPWSLAVLWSTKYELVSQNRDLVGIGPPDACLYAYLRNNLTGRKYTRSAICGCLMKRPCISWLLGSFSVRLGDFKVLLNPPTPSSSLPSLDIAKVEWSVVTLYCTAHLYRRGRPLYPYRPTKKPT